MSACHGTSVASEMRHLLLYSGWMRQLGGRNRSEKQAAISETVSAFTLFLLSNCHCVSSNVFPSQSMTFTSSCYWPSISYANI